jgi:hypothetical protein
MLRRALMPEACAAVEARVAYVTSGFGDIRGAELQS